MIRNQVFGLVLVAAGILANNYVYLHDLVWDRHNGAIYLGSASLMAIAVAIIVTIAGILLVARAPAGDGN